MNHYLRATAAPLLFGCVVHALNVGERPCIRHKPLARPWAALWGGVVPNCRSVQERGSGLVAATKVWWEMAACRSASRAICSLQVVHPLGQPAAFRRPERPGSQPHPPNSKVAKSSQFHCSARASIHRPRVHLLLIGSTPSEAINCRLLDCLGLRDLNDSKAISSNRRQGQRG